MSKNDTDERITAVEKSLNYIFNKKGLLLEALTHKSYFHENKDKVSAYNERLEFLGDSVIGLIIVEHLFILKDDYTESVLAKIKSYLVCEAVFADIAASISLGNCLFLGKGEEATGGRSKKSVLADALEALIGAVYLDGGYTTAKKIVLDFFKEKITAAVESGEFYDFKTELQEKSQSLFGILPEYRVIKQQGEEHKRIFTVAVSINGEECGVASGKKKKEAEASAAKIALEKIRQTR